MITSEADALLTEMNQVIEVGQPYQYTLSQTIVINPDHVIVKDIGGIDKLITLVDFKVILDGLLDQGPDLSLKSMPFNCFVFGGSISSMELGCYYPGKVFEVSYDNGSGSPTKYKVPLPNIIISFRLIKDGRGWMVNKVNYFSTDKRVTQLAENTMIWRKDEINGIYGIPFPNFYNDGLMCYGRNVMPVVFTDNLRGLDYYYQVIINSPFNSDLGVKFVNWRKSVREWFEYLSTLEEFPYQLFIK